MHEYKKWTEGTKLLAQVSFNKYWENLYAYAADSKSFLGTVHLDLTSWWLRWNNPSSTDMLSTCISCTYETLDWKSSWCDKNNYIVPYKDDKLSITNDCLQLLTLIYSLILCSIRLSTKVVRLLRCANLRHIQTY